MSIERHNSLHPNEKAKECYVTTELKGRKGPVIAATDYMRIFAEQIRPFISSRYVTLGTDGYGRSDTREHLRHFFEVDAKFIVLAALNALVADGEIDKSKVADAIKRYKINPDKLDPVTH